MQIELAPKECKDMILLNKLLKKENLIVNKIKIIIYLKFCNKKIV